MLPLRHTSFELLGHDVNIFSFVGDSIHGQVAVADDLKMAQERLLHWVVFHLKFSNRSVNFQ